MRKPCSLELFVFADTGLGVWSVVCAVVAIPATVFLLCWCGSLPLLLSKDFRSGMLSDGFQTQRRGSWIPVKERAEKVLASAVSIDVRKVDV